MGLATSKSPLLRLKYAFSLKQVYSIENKRISIRLLLCDRWTFDSRLHRLLYKSALKNPSFKNCQMLFQKRYEQGAINTSTHQHEPYFITSDELNLVKH